MGNNQGNGTKSEVIQGRSRVLCERRLKLWKSDRLVYFSLGRKFIQNTLECRNPGPLHCNNFTKPHHRYSWVSALFTREYISWCLAYTHHHYYLYFL